MVFSNRPGEPVEQAARRRRRLRGVVVLVACAALVVALILSLVSSGPSRVAADALPIEPDAVVGSSYTECSPLTETTYMANLPCDTWILIRARRPDGAHSELVAEDRWLRKHHWRRARGGWFNPSNDVCASVVSARSASSGEFATRGQTNHEKATFVSAVRAARGTDDMFADVYPAFFQGVRRC
jgi:hypothetical protein